MIKLRYSSHGRLRLSYAARHLSGCASAATAGSHPLPRFSGAMILCEQRGYVMHAIGASQRTRGTWRRWWCRLQDLFDDISLRGLPILRHKNLFDQILGLVVSRHENIIHVCSRLIDRTYCIFSDKADRTNILILVCLVEDRAFPLFFQVQKERKKVENRANSRDVFIFWLASIISFEKKKSPAAVVRSSPTTGRNSGRITSARGGGSTQTARIEWKVTTQAVAQGVSALRCPHRVRPSWSRKNIHRTPPYETSLVADQKKPPSFPFPTHRALLAVILPVIQLFRSGVCFASAPSATARNATCACGHSRFLLPPPAEDPATAGAPLAPGPLFPEACPPELGPETWGPCATAPEAVTPGTEAVCAALCEPAS